MAKEKEKVEQIVFTGEQVENILIALNELGWYDLFLGVKESDLTDEDYFIINRIKAKNAKEMITEWTKEEIAVNMKINKASMVEEAKVKKELLTNIDKTKKLASLFYGSEITDIRIAEREIFTKMPIFQAEFL